MPDRVVIEFPDAGAASLSSAIELHRQGRFTEAEGAYIDWLERSPNDAVALSNLSCILRDRGEYEAAASLSGRAVAARPMMSEARLNFGNALRDLGRLAMAIDAYRNAIALHPHYAEAHANLAIAFRDQGALDDAIAHGRTALSINPAYARAHSHLLYTLLYHPDLQSHEVSAEHRRWGAAHADPLSHVATPHVSPHLPSGDLDRRLRIGYVSPYFRQHAVMAFCEPVFAHHDRSRFEILFYDGGALHDASSVRLVAYADVHRDVHALGDEALAAQIRADHVDVLVDLTGHIGGSRLLCFARRPAPVQVTWLGYQHTTGMMAMDYRITDSIADPPELADAHYTETLCRVAPAFFAYRPAEDAPAVVPPPCLSRGHITFGSFNNRPKINEAVIALWARLLSEVAGSTLLILGAEAHDPALARTFADHGVTPHRLRIVGRQPVTAYRALFSEVDIALDPFPFSGHTTTCDALWQGLPVVTLAGESYASRMSASVLINLGLGDWVTRDAEGYVTTARRLAADPERLRQFRLEARTRLRASPLMDGLGFTRKLETAYLEMHRRWRDAVI